MAQPYVGEIRMFGGNFAPAGWQFCDGSLLPISEFDTLFNLIGTTYGGDGQSTFAVPDLRGRLPIHQGNSFTIGQNGGVENVTLTVQQIPAHTHAYLGSSSVSNDPNPGGNVVGQSTTISLYESQAPSAAMAASGIGSIGGSQPHNNFQPYLCVDFIISLFGVFPSQT
jgi:microcystin-dependent protein